MCFAYFAVNQTPHPGPLPVWRGEERNWAGNAALRALISRPARSLRQGGLIDFAGQVAWDCLRSPACSKTKSAIANPPPTNNTSSNTSRSGSSSPTKSSASTSSSSSTTICRTPVLWANICAMSPPTKANGWRWPLGARPPCTSKPGTPFIGWTEEQRRQRLPLVVNNSRLYVLPECHYPNLVSRFMKLMLGRLSPDWESAWGHPVALAESFVDPQAVSRHRLQGQWLEPVGAHARLEAQRGGFLREARPAQASVDARTGQERLRQTPRAGVAARSGPGSKRTPRPAARPRSRRSQSDRSVAGRTCRSSAASRRLAYPMAGMLALIAMAMFSGVRRGPKTWPTTPPRSRKGSCGRLGFRLDQHTGRVRCPGVTTFPRVLSGVDADALERVLLAVAGTSPGAGAGPAGDCRRQETPPRRRGVGQRRQRQGRWLGTVPVKAGSNEIPAARELLAKLELVDKTCWPTRLIRRSQTVQQILFEGGGDYLLTVKENQKELFANPGHAVDAGEIFPLGPRRTPAP